VHLVAFFFLQIDLKTNISLVHRSAPAPTSSQVLVTQIQYTNEPTGLCYAHQPAFIQTQPKLNPCGSVSKCPSSITNTGADQKTGVAELGAASELAREHTVSIPFLKPISEASVSALIEGT
jgi:hypothetical protein